MAVFKPDQVLVSPVSEYYRGKAIRQELKTGELKNKALEFDIEAAPERLQRERNRDKRADEQLKNLKRQQKLQEAKFIREVGEAQAKVYAETLYTGLWTAEQKMKEVGDEAGLEYAGQFIQEYASSLPEKHRARALAVLSDGRVTKDEFNLMKAGVLTRLDKYNMLDETKTRPASYVNYVKVDEGGNRVPGTVTMARPDSARTDELQKMGYVVDEGLGKSGTDGGTDFKKSAATLWKDEDFTKAMKDHYKNFLDEYDTSQLKSGRIDIGMPNKAKSVEDNFRWLAAVYQANNQGTPPSVVARTVFNWMFEIGEPGKGGKPTITIRPPEVVHDGEKVLMRLPGPMGNAGNGTDWYTINTP